MPTALAARLAQLSAASIIPTPPQQLKAEILDLAKLCQVLPDQQFLLRTTARDMAPLVQRVFGPLAMIFPLTETGRRHVYLAVLAKLDRENRIDAMDNAAWIALLEKLLTQRNGNLIADAYGSNPKGFLRLATRLGDVARGQQFYLDLHSLLSDAPELAAALLSATGGEPLSDAMLEMMKRLPRMAGAVTLARHFPDHRRLETFLVAYQALVGGKEIKKAHMERIGAGEHPARIIEDLYLSCAFPLPQIQSHPQITHIKNGYEMTAAAKIFRNCLHFYVHEALRGDLQFYVWRKPGAESVAFAIRSDHPYGWILNEASHEENNPLTLEHENELHALLQEFGITRSFSMGQQIKDFCSPEYNGEIIPF